MREECCQAWSNLCKATATEEPRSDSHLLGASHSGNENLADEIVVRNLVVRHYCVECHAQHGSISPRQKWSGDDFVVDQDCSLACA